MTKLFDKAGWKMYLISQLEMSIVTLLISLKALQEYIEFRFERFVIFFALRSWVFIITSGNYYYYNFGPVGRISL